MTVVRRLVIFVLLLTATAIPSWAFDPLGTEILALRLGMSEAKVIDSLKSQGWQFGRVAQCVADGCPEAIRAKTGDGLLLIDFAPGGVVSRITYTLNIRSRNAEYFSAVFLDHFGVPSAHGPMSWCRSVAADGRCPRNQPRLTFLPGDTSGCILTLAAGD